MGDYSRAELFDWMQRDSRMWNWGMIACFDRGKLNTLLTQEYIRRFKTTSYLPSQSGSIANGDERRFALNAFTLDRPRLSFENINLNDSKARLRMSVVGGAQLALKKQGSAWYIREIREISPLQGPELILNLQLADVPGVVGRQGELSLDLSKSDDFRLTVSDDRIEQQLVGAYFQQKFSELPDAKRVFNFGRLEPGDNPALRAESFALRTQARRRTPDDPEGAVLSFVRWRGEREGAFPSADSDFKYLIPSDGEDDSFTLLLDQQRVALAQLLGSLSEVASGLEFDITQDGQGKVIGAMAKSGTLRIPAQEFEHEFELERSSELLKVKVAVDAMDLPMGGLLSISSSDSTVKLEWTVKSTLGLQILDLDNETGSLKNLFETFKFDLTDFKERVSDTFEYRVFSEYKFTSAEGGKLENLKLDFSEIKAPDIEFNPIKPPPLPPPDDSTDFPEYLSALFIVGVLVMLLSRTFIKDFLQISDSAVPSVESVLREELERDFLSSSLIKPLVNQIVKLNFGNTVIVDEVRSPLNIGVFGSINPQLTQFVIDPLEHNMVAGSTHAFGVTPAGATLEWSVEPVLDTVLAEQVGSIDANGRYTAPAASAFSGPFVRVRVNARNAANGASSSALVTVLKSALQVNPLVYVTAAGGSVTLDAGYLGDAAKLKWTLQKPDQGGRLQGTGLQVTYTAPMQIPDTPSGTRLAFMQETVQISADDAPQQSVVIIVDSATKQPLLMTKVVDVAAGTVTLRVLVNGNPQEPQRTQWEVAYGGGVIDPQTGVYTQAKDDPHAFAILVGRVDGGIFGTFEGYVIQPLPLQDLDDAVNAQGVFAIQPSIGSTYS